MGGATPTVVHPVRGRETVSEAVVLAVLERLDPPGRRVEDAPLDELDDLSATLDPDALDGLFGHGFDGRLEFHWSGCSIVVEAGTTVVVTPQP